MKITLHVVKGPNCGQSYCLEDHDTFIVGRGSTAHLRLPPKDRFFSRNHFMIEANPPLCRLMDMASLNGTFVNDQRVTEADLRDGDLIRGGDTIIRVCLERAQTAEETQRIVGRGVVSPRQPVVRHTADPTDGLATTVNGPLDSPGGQAQESEPVERVGRFRLIREIGRGGMGIVYLATAADERRQLALKTIKANGPFSERDVQQFLREASILQRLRHPNVVKFHECGEADGQVYLCMEYVPGQDLQQLVDESGPLSTLRATRIICEMLRALDYAHSRRFIHRDIKPANVLVVEKNAETMVKLTDFGLARIYQASRMSGLTMQGEMGGSLAFMAPEQITDYRGAMPASDLYSAAASLYTLLTRFYVFDFPERLPERLLMILQDDPVPITARRSDLPAELAAIVHQGLQRDPAQRFESAAAMRNALLPFAEMS